MFSLSVAPHGHHAGDGRLPGEASRRRERALHSAADAGLPGERRAAVFTPVWGRCDPLPDTVAWPCAAPPV